MTSDDLGASQMPPCRKIPKHRLFLPPILNCKCCLKVWIFPSPSNMVGGFSIHTLHTNEVAHLIPGPCFPLGWAGDSVTGPAALRSLPQAVLAVHRAVGTIMEWLQAAHSAELVAGVAAAFAAVFPFLCCPAVGARASSEVHCEHLHGAMPRTSIFWTNAPYSEMIFLTQHFAFEQQKDLSVTLLFVK